MRMLLGQIMFETGVESGAMADCFGRDAYHCVKGGQDVAKTGEVAIRKHQADFQLHGNRQLFEAVGERLPLFEDVAASFSPRPCCQ
jgi:hypothetical protein